MTAARLRRQATGQRGSMALELVVLAPVLVLVVWLLGVYALRLAVANGDVEAAARDAARSASIARTAAGAQAAAAASAATSLASSGRVCRSLQVATSTADFRAGGTVTVTVTCAIRLQDLAPLRLGAARDVQQAYTAPIDPYTGIALGFGDSEGSLGAKSGAVGPGG